MTDPRHDNCRQFRTDPNGKVTGVELRVIPVGNQYALRSVRLLDENEARGVNIATVAVHDRNGLPVSVPVRLGYPFNGGAEMQHSLLPGNAKLPAEHVIANGFNPPAIGPLAIYIGEHNQAISDVVGGLGLPLHRHVSYHLVYQERTSAQPPPPPPPSGGNVEIRLDRLERDIESLRRALRPWVAAG